MLALKGLEVDNLDLPIMVLPEQDPPDFHTPARYQVIRIYHRQTNLFENQTRVEDLERRLRHAPTFHVAIDRVGHHFAP
jgi:hypothetical protein